MTLKIQRSSNGESSVFRLSGRFEVQHIPELQKLMDLATGDIILDLQELNLADRETIEFLTRAEANGTGIKNCPVHIRDWISKTK
jgi:hypothetical protein